MAEHDKRMVYEVAGTFSSPYSRAGFTWPHGMKVYVVDAATGELLHMQILGTPSQMPAAVARRN
jgi:hypothetical protein